jgi:hypothetical protein
LASIPEVFVKSNRRSIAKKVNKINNKAHATLYKAGKIKARQNRTITPMSP